MTAAFTQSPVSRRVAHSPPILPNDHLPFSALTGFLLKREPEARQEDEDAPRPRRARINPRTAATRNLSATVLLSAGVATRMLAGATTSLRAGIAAFIRAEFFSRLNVTFTLRMGPYLMISHDCLLARVTFAYAN